MPLPGVTRAAWLVALAVALAACGGSAAVATPTVPAPPTAAPTATATPVAGPFSGQRWQEMPLPEGTRVEETSPDTATLSVPLSPSAAEEWFQKTWSADGFKLATKGNVQKGMSYNFIKGDYIYSCIFPGDASGDSATVFLEREKR